MFWRDWYFDFVHVLLLVFDIYFAIFVVTICFYLPHLSVLVRYVRRPEKEVISCKFRGDKYSRTRRARVTRHIGGLRQHIGAHLIKGRCRNHVAFSVHLPRDGSIIGTLFIISPCPCRRAGVVGNLLTHFFVNFDMFGEERSLNFRKMRLGESVAMRHFSEINYRLIDTYQSFLESGLDSSSLRRLRQWRPALGLQRTAQENLLRSLQKKQHLDNKINLGRKAFGTG